MKLIPKSSESWKLYSQQAFAVVVAVQGIWMSLTPEQQSLVPDNLVNIATIIAGVVGAVARVISQDKEPETDA